MKTPNFVNPIRTFNLKNILDFSDLLSHTGMFGHCINASVRDSSAMLMTEHSNIEYDSVCIDDLNRYFDSITTLFNKYGMDEHWF